MPEGVDFDSIIAAADREQSVPTKLVAEAVKEEDVLFRKELKRNLLRVTKFLIYFTLFIFCTTVLVRLWHLLIPNWGWIDAEHLKVIDELLKSGALVAAGGVLKDVIVKSLPAESK